MDTNWIQHRSNKRGEGEPLRFYRRPPQFPEGLHHYGNDHGFNAYRTPFKPRFSWPMKMAILVELGPGIRLAAAR